MRPNRKPMPPPRLERCRSGHSDKRIRPVYQCAIAVDTFGRPQPPRAGRWRCKGEMVAAMARLAIRPCHRSGMATRASQAAAVRAATPGLVPITGVRRSSPRRAGSGAAPSVARVRMPCADNAAKVADVSSPVTTGRWKKRACGRARDLRGGDVDELWSPGLHRHRPRRPTDHECRHCPGRAPGSSRSSNRGPAARDRLQGRQRPLATASIPAAPAGVGHRRQHRLGRLVDSSPALRSIATTSAYRSAAAAATDVDDGGSGIPDQLPAGLRSESGRCRTSTPARGRDRPTRSGSGVGQGTGPALGHRLLRTAQASAQRRRQSPGRCAASTGAAKAASSVTIISAGIQSTSISAARRPSSDRL